jgi:ABC-type multidrug transport system fused ATPase/permease subunit
MFGYFLKFFYILEGKKKQLFGIGFLFLLTSLLETVGIGLIGPFIALATNLNLIHQNSWSHELYTQLGFDSEVKFVSSVGLGIIAILYVKSFLGFNVQKYIFEFGFSQQANLRSRLMQAYLKAPYLFHISRNTAGLIQNIITETQNFANGILMPLLFSLSNITVMIGLIILLIQTNFIATASIFVVLLGLFALVYQFKDKLARWGKEGHEADTEMIRIINHGLGGFKETKVIGCESYFESQIVIQAERFKVAVASANAFSLLPRYILEPLIITFLVAFALAYLITNQSPETLASTLGVFGMASIRLLPAASNVIQTVGGLRHSTYVLDRLYLDLKEVEKVVETKRKTKQLSEAKSNLSFEKEVVLDRVTYQYPGVADPSLKDISLALRRGESIGLIGKSGAGKTTLVDVILGLLTPDTGEIKVDGISVGDNLRSWQNLIGYIPQSIFLTDDTIERNIAFGVTDDKIDRKRLHQAIQAAQLTELMQDLPEGLETVVGERGVRLSGGQRQRVGIARALYHEREILVLDEATAALDNETESLVTEAIKSLSGKKTTIIIAHRLSTIEHCDRIYLLEKGQIVKSGSYQDVVLDKQTSH